MADSFYLNNIQLETVDLATNNNIRTETTPVIGAQFVLNAIGEYKRLTLNYKLDGGASLDDGSLREIRFTPALYIQYGTVAYFPGYAPQHYLFIIPSGAADGTTWIGTLINTMGMPAENRIHNLSVFAERIDANNLNLLFEFYVTQDMAAYLPAIGVNQSRFFRSHVNDTQDFQTYNRSVFGTSNDRAIGLYVHYTNVTAGEVLRVENQIRFSAGMYNRESGDVPGAYYNPRWEYSVGGMPCVGLSTVQSTLVRLTVECTTDLDNCLLYLVRADTTNDNIEFPDNYDISHAEIIDAPTGVLHRALIGPATGPAPTYGSDWEVTVSIDHTYITTGAAYRIIAILYSTTDDHTVSQISQQLQGGAQVGWTGEGITVNRTWRDYVADYANCSLQATICERLRYTVSMLYPGDALRSDFLARFGIDGANDIRRYLTSIRGQVWHRRTDQAGVLYTTDRVDMLYDTQVYRLPDGSYPTVNGIGFSTVTNGCVSAINFRCRYENHIPCLYTLYDGVIQPSAVGNQYWGGKQLTVRLTFELYYHDAAVPFTDIIQFDAGLTVRDYMASGEYSLTPIESDICTVDNACLVATLPVSASQPFKLITTIEAAPGNSGTVEETETFTGLLPTMVSPKILSQETSFGETIATKANFCVDGSELIPGINYLINAIAKRT
jgi:hypothetical protein